MVLNAPLSVRVSDGTTDRMVTRNASALSFTKVAPGGHQSCQFRLNLPLGTFSDLGPQDKCWIYDKRTAETIFGAGYLENPNPVDGQGGQAFDVKAFGGMALASDESRPLIYIDQNLDTWRNIQYGAALKGATGASFDDRAVGGVTGMIVQFPDGSVATTGSVAAVDNYSLANAGMNIAAVRVFTISGKDDTGYRTELFDGTTVISVGDPTKMSVTGTDQTFWVPTLANTGAVNLQLRRSGAPTTVANDTTWTKFAVLSLLGRRVDRFGNILSTAAAHGSNATTVLASQVVEDLLGRVLRFCNPSTAVIEATAYAINQLAYPTGVRPESVLTGLTDFEPDFYWGIGASDSDGLHEFWYRQWATEPRYVVSVRDGWRQTGSDSDLCNRIVVYYTDSAGNQQHEEVTAASLGLVGIGLPVDALGSRVRDAESVTLPEGFGSTANAQQIGAAILRDKINPPLAGTVQVRGPILDRLTGNQVMPWELEPGWPVLVREPGYSLRCTEMTYDDQAVAATLTLGRPVLTESQRVAKLARVA